MHKKAFSAVAILSCLAVAAQAATTVTAGNYVFAPNTNGNVVTITAAGNDQVQGMNFLLEIGDGVSPGLPQFTSADIINGGIFGPNNTGQFVLFPVPNPNAPGALTTPGAAYYGSVTTATGTVGTTGVLGTMLVSTVGVAPGVYPLNLGISQFFDVLSFAAAGPVATTLVNGTITIVPEPGTVVMGLFAVAGLGAVALRRRARKAA